MPQTLIQGLLALLVLTLLGLHTAQQYFQGLPNRSPQFDQSSAVLVGLLIAVALLPEIDSLKVWIFEFRTKQQVTRARKDVEQTFETPAAKREAESAARNDIDPRKLITESQKSLEATLQEVAERHGVASPSRSLTDLGRQLKDNGAIDDKTFTAITSLAQAIAKALSSHDVSLGLASQVEYSAELLRHSSRSR